MKMKKMAAVLSAAAMAVTSLSMTAFAAGDSGSSVPTTAVEVTDFAGLKTALAADPAPTEITLKGQIVVNEDIDLKGTTLKATSAEYMSSNKNGMILIDGDVKVSNGTIDGDDMDYNLNSGNGYYVVHVLGGHSEVTFENMTVKSGYPSENQTGTNFTKSSIINVSTHLTLKNCNIATNGKSAALKADDAGFTIDGGTVASYFPIMMWENVTIKGGAEVKAVGGINAIQIGVWQGYSEPTKVNIEDATIDGAVSILSKQANVWPIVNVGENVTLKNFDVVKSDAYKDTAFDTINEIEAGLTINPDTSVTLAAAAVDGGTIANEQLGAALKNVKNVTNSEGKTITVGENGKVTTTIKAASAEVNKYPAGYADNAAASQAKLGAAAATVDDGIITVNFSEKTKEEIEKIEADGAGRKDILYLNITTDAAANFDAAKFAFTKGYGWDDEDHKEFNVSEKNIMLWLEPFGGDKVITYTTENGAAEQTLTIKYTYKQPETVEKVEAEATATTPAVTVDTKGVDGAAVLKEGTTLKVEAKDSSDNEAVSAALKAGTAKIFDISLMKGGKEVKPDGKVKVTIGIPEGLTIADDADKVYVYHVEADGKLKDMNATYDKTAKTVTFITDSFSEYIISANEIKATEKPEDETNTIDFTPTTDGYEPAGTINVKGKSGNVLVMEITTFADTDLSTLRLGFADGQVRWGATGHDTATEGTLYTTDGKTLIEIFPKGTAKTATVKIDLKKSNISKVGDEIVVHTQGNGTGPFKIAKVDLEEVKEETTTEASNGGPVAPNIRPVAPEASPEVTDANGNVVTTEPAATTAEDGSSTNGGDKNQSTGVLLAVIPAIVAAAGVVISKKRK